MLGAVYHNAAAGASSQQANRDRLHKILEFWGLKEVYPRDTVSALQQEMQAGGAPLPCFPLSAPCWDISLRTAAEMLARDALGLG